MIINDIRQKYKGKFKLFNILTNCTICNKYEACAKYCDELICDACYGNMNKYKGNGSERINQYREKIK